MFLKVWETNLKRRLKSDISLSQTMSPTQRSITPSPRKRIGVTGCTPSLGLNGNGCSPEPVNRTEEIPGTLALQCGEEVSAYKNKDGKIIGLEIEYEWTRPDPC